MAVCSRCPHWIVVFLLMAVGMSLGPNLLLAYQVGLTVQATSGAGTNGQSNTQNFAESLVPSTIVVSPQVATISFVDPQSGLSTSATGNSSGTVEFGAIAGAVSASGVESFSLEPPGLNVADTGASGLFQGFWQDSLIVTSNTLALGTAVNLLFSLSVDGTLTCSGPDAGVDANAGFKLVTMRFRSQAILAILRFRELKRSY